MVRDPTHLGNVLEFEVFGRASWSFQSHDGHNFKAGILTVRADCVLINTIGADHPMIFENCIVSDFKSLVATILRVLPL